MRNLQEFAGQKGVDDRTEKERGRRQIEGRNRHPVRQRFADAVQMPVFVAGEARRKINIRPVAPTAPGSQGDARMEQNDSQGN